MPTHDSNLTAVLLMAYGSPNTLDEIEPYYTDIRGGRKPTPENLRQLTERYQRIGGRTPLLEITQAQATALERELNNNGNRYRVYVGMKHWHPYISQTVSQISEDGFRRMIALTLAPHYSRFSTDGYIQGVQDAITKTNPPLEVCYVESWNDHPLFLRSIADRMEQARAAFGLNDWHEIQVIFSAHSLPERILQSNDPYPQELRETCEAVASLLGLDEWVFAYQSAGRTGEKWLGPDILDALNALAAQERRRVLVAPIGFVADHLEVLYDIDVECAERAHQLGIELRRIESPNVTPRFIAALADIVRKQKARTDNRAGEP